MERSSGRRELLVSKGWVQAVALVVLFGFFVLGLRAYRTYTGQPPIPERVVDPEGNVVYTGEDVTAGQEVFLRNGIMEYGSIFGHGAYLGPDFTADYLRRAALSVRDSYGGEGSDRAAVSTVEDFKENRYDPETGTLELTAPQAAAFEELRGHYGEFFGEPSTSNGLRPEAISDPELIRNHSPAEILALGTALAVTGTVARHLHKAFRASPANFPAAPAQPPEPIPAQALRTGNRKSKEAQR